MSTLFTFIAFLLFLATLAGTLELLFLTVMSFFPHRHIADSKEAESVRLAIVIPAHNEEKGLHLTLESLQSCDNPVSKDNLVVIADNCTDATAEVAHRCGVRVLERQDDQLRGKGYALDYAFNTLLDEDQHDGFIVVDADTTVDSNLLDSFRRLFAQGGDAGQSRYRVANANVNNRTRLMDIAFLAINLVRPAGRENAGLSAGILGTGFGLSSATLKEIPYDSFSIVEDLEYHLRLIQANKRVRFLAETTVWSDMPESKEEAKSQRERWEGGRFRMVLDLVPGMLKTILTQGRVRVIEPLFELLLMPLGYHVMLVLPILLLGGAMLRSYAIAALILVVLYVVRGMQMGKVSSAHWKALAGVPVYVFRKVINVGGVLKKAKKGAGWERTGR